MRRAPLGSRAACTPTDTTVLQRLPAARLCEEARRVEVQHRHHSQASCKTARCSPHPLSRPCRSGRQSCSAGSAAGRSLRGCGGHVCWVRSQLPGNRSPARQAGRTSTLGRTSTRCLAKQHMQGAERQLVQRVQHRGRRALGPDAARASVRTAVWCTRQPPRAAGQHRPQQKVRIAPLAQMPQE